MNNFIYYNPAKICFGKDSLNELNTLLKSKNIKSLLVIYGGDYVKSLGIWDALKNTCEKNHIKLFENRDVVPNPKVELVYELINLGKTNNIDYIIAIGGGSAIDTAKAVAVGIPYPEDVWDFFTGKATIKKAIPIGVISTIPSSGSETSSCAIISNKLLKRGIDSNYIIPEFAIMNPCFTLNLPSFQTSCGIADILSHLLERYFTNTTFVDTTDYLIEGAIKSLLINAERVIKCPENYNARSEIQLLASIAHSNILDVGREQDWGSHRIEHELSASYDLTHGEGMAIIFIAWAKYMSKHKPKKLAQLANRIWGYDYNNYSEEELAYKVPENLEKFFKSINLKTTLKEVNIDSSLFNEMALRATNNDTITVGHYIPLNSDKIIVILTLALD